MELLYFGSSGGIFKLDSQLVDEFAEVLTLWFPEIIVKWWCSLLDDLNLVNVCCNSEWGEQLGEWDIAEWQDMDWCLHSEVCYRNTEELLQPGSGNESAWSTGESQHGWNTPLICVKVSSVNRMTSIALHGCPRRGALQQELAIAAGTWSRRFMAKKQHPEPASNDRCGLKSQNVLKRSYSCSFMVDVRCDRLPLFSLTRHARDSGGST